MDGDVKFYKLVDEGEYGKAYSEIDITTDFDSDFVLFSDIEAMEAEGNFLSWDYHRDKVDVLYFDKILARMLEDTANSRVNRYSYNFHNCFDQDLLNRLKEGGVAFDHVSYTFMRTEEYNKINAKKREKGKSRKKFLDTVAVCGKTNRELVEHWRELIMEMNEFSKENKLPLRGNSTSKQEWHFHEVITLAKKMGFETKYGGFYEKMVRSPKRYAVKFIDN